MVMTCIAWLIMFASWCVAYRTIDSLKKELNRFKYNESHYKAVLKEVEDFFRTMDSCRGYPPNTDIGKIANVAFKHWLYVESRQFSNFIRTDIMSLKPRFKISVPIFRVDYNYIKLSDVEYIFR